MNFKRVTLYYYIVMRNTSLPDLWRILSGLPCDVGSHVGWDGMGRYFKRSVGQLLDKCFI